MQKTRFPLGQYPRTDASPLILIPEDEQQSWMREFAPMRGHDFDVTAVKWLRFAHGGVFGLHKDTRVPLELCPTSNLQTGAAPSIAEHPIGVLAALRFRVTVNTDNRLMSGTSMSLEMQKLVEAFDYSLADLRWFTINAMKSAFISFDARLAIIDDVIKPRYAVLVG